MPKVYNKLVSHRIRILLAIFLIHLPSVSLAVDWLYNPPHAGRALDGGGWFQAYTLGTIAASPEFTFPLQLVYENTWDANGLFGPQWFCPQLESTVTPEGAGYIVWKMPSGMITVFQTDENDSRRLLDAAHTWMGTGDPGEFTIQNQEGWIYQYHHGHLVSVTSPTGRMLQFTWSGDQFQAVQLVDSRSHDTAALIQAVGTDPRKVGALAFNGIQHQFAFYPGHDGRLAAWQAPTNKKFAFTYADVGILEYITSSDGTTLTFNTRINNPKLDKVDQANPALWDLVQDPDQKYDYDATGAVKLTADQGISETRESNYKRGIVTETLPNGIVRKTYYYRAPGQRYDGKLRRIEENGKILVEYYYSRKSGLLTSMVDEHGNITYFAYPNQSVSASNPWPPKPIRIWQGTPDHPKVLAAYNYDAAGHVIAAQDQNGHVTQYQYDDRNELVGVVNPQGVSTSAGYDSFGRLTKVQSGSVTQTLEYDSLGRVKTQTGADGSTSTFTYDGLGNVVQVARNGKPALEYIRDAQGQVTGIKDALGRIKKVQYDAQGNLLEEIAPDGSCTRYEYDKYNRRISQTDGNGNKTTFAYDPGSHLILQTNALGETIKWDYDAHGKLSSKITPEQTIKNRYDADGHLISVDYGSKQTITYEYDDQDRVVSAITPDTAYYTIFNDQGQVEALRYVLGQDEELLRFRYNSYGQRTGLLLARLQGSVAPSGGKIGQNAQYEILQQTEYDYDERNRLSSIASCGIPVITYQYDSLNRITRKTFGNGMMANLGYDSMGRLAQIVFSGGPLSSALTLAYEWDAADQITRRSWNGSTQRYEYDPAGHLAKVIDDKTSNVLEAYVYDKAGNMMKKTLNGQKTTMSYNAANELVSTTGPEGALQYTYDKAGRLTRAPSGVVTTYGWLDKAVKLSGTNGVQTLLTYWPDGQLAEKRPAKGGNQFVSFGPGADETYLWDGLALLRRGDLIYVTEPHPNGGTVIASHSISDPKTITYYLNDLLGTSLASITNSALQITNLTSFGQPVSNAAPTNPIAQPITPPSTISPVPPTQQIPPSSN